MRTRLIHMLTTILVACATVPNPEPDPNLAKVGVEHERKTICNYRDVGEDGRTKSVHAGVVPESECRETKAAAKERIRQHEDERQREREDMKREARDAAQARAQAYAELHAHVRTPEVAMPLLSAFRCVERLKRAEAQAELKRQKRIGQRAGYDNAAAMVALSTRIEATHEDERLIGSTIREKYGRGPLPCARVNSAAECLHEAGSLDDDLLVHAYQVCGELLPGSGVRE